MYFQSTVSRDTWIFYNKEDGFLYALMVHITLLAADSDERLDID